MSRFPDIYGYSIFLEVNDRFEEEKKQFKQIDDYEIMGLIQSKMLNVISKNCKSYEDIISNSLKFQKIKLLFLNYGRIALFANFFMENIYSVIYVPGTINPLDDLQEIKSELKKIGEF
ncbi:MAG: hypothetical protein GF353_19150 [Candidatus Lokiarchaeota archaeon]|nr:hypothetical protein [Candidatus Lokiarchaeota archaeon]